jgi:hypothetical protein
MIPRTVVAVVTSTADRRRLSRLARGLSLRLRCCATIDDVPAAVSRLSAAALLTPACDGAGTPVAPALREIRRLAPTLAIVLLIGPRCPSNIALAALRVADDALFDADLGEASLWFAITRAATRRARPGCPAKIPMIGTP